MLFAAALLTLLPFVFMPDLFEHEPEEAEADRGDTGGQAMDGGGGLLDMIAPVQALLPDTAPEETTEPGQAQTALQPETGDEEPGPAQPVDPAQVIAPSIEGDQQTEAIAADAPILAPSEYASGPPEEQNQVTLLDTLLAERFGAAPILSTGEVETDNTASDDGGSDLASADPVLTFANEGSDTPPEVTGFVSGDHILSVTLEGSALQDEPLVDVAPSESGEDGIVSLDGEVLAVLRGAADATTQDVRIDFLIPATS